MSDLSWESPFVQFGVGAFETMRCHRGTVPLLGLHRQRLHLALSAWELKPLVLEEAWADLLITLSQLDEDSTFRVKLLIGLDQHHNIQHQIFTQPHQDNPKPRRLLLSSSTSCYESLYKSSSYEQHFLARHKAHSLGFDDGIYQALSGELLESSTAALFLWNEEKLLCVKSGNFLRSVLKTHLLNNFSDHVQTIPHIEMNSLKEHALLLGNALQGFMPVDSISGTSDDSESFCIKNKPVDPEWIRAWNDQLFSTPTP
jgi:branched-subunit amino acid aminotransferase/4-amino-4-deoxychorismate lyase